MINIVLAAQGLSARLPNAHSNPGAPLPALWLPFNSVAFKCRTFNKLAAPMGSLTASAQESGPLWPLTLKLSH